MNTIPNGVTVKPEEEASDVCHRSPHASTLEPYINPPSYFISLSSELPSSLLSPHFRRAGRPHQFALVLGSWSYASVREMNVALGCFSFILTAYPLLGCGSRAPPRDAVSYTLCYYFRRHSEGSIEQRRRCPSVAISGMSRLM